MKHGLKCSESSLQRQHLFPLMLPLTSHKRAGGKQSWQPFPKKWQPSYLNLHEYICNLHNCWKEKKEESFVSETFQYFNKRYRNESTALERPVIITKTRLYNFGPLKPHFYIVKLGFTGLGYKLFFLFLLKNIDCGYSLEPPHRGGSNEYPQSMFWAEIRKISGFFTWKISVFGGELYYIFE